MEKKIRKILLEEEHGDGCAAYFRNGTLKELKGMEPNKCTCSKPERVCEKIEKLLKN